VHLVRDDEPRYVVLSEEDYAELLEGYAEAQLAPIRASLEEAAAGRVQRFETTAELMAAIDDADDDDGPS
jgi:hypothetical protein